jgi:hypothetical protein
MKKDSRTILFENNPSLAIACEMYRIGYNTETCAWYEFTPRDHSLRLRLRSETETLWETFVSRTSRSRYASLVGAKIFAPTFEELTCKGEQRLPTSIVARDYANPNDTQEYTWELSAWHDNIDMVAVSYLSQSKEFCFPSGHTFNVFRRNAIDAMCALWVELYKNNAKRLMCIENIRNERAWYNETETLNILDNEDNK